MKGKSSGTRHLAAIERVRTDIVKGKTQIDKSRAAVSAIRVRKSFTEVSNTDTEQSKLLALIQK